MSPVVRKIAREHRIDVRSIAGSGAGGRVTKNDILSYLEAGAPVTPTAGTSALQPARIQPVEIEGVDRKPMSVMRRKIAEHMVMSKRTSAHVHSVFEIDMTRVMRLRERAKEEFKQREGVSLSPMPFAVLALVAAIREYPKVNSAMDEDGNLHVYQDVHLGVAVDTPKGLFVPVVKNAESLNLAGRSAVCGNHNSRRVDGCQCQSRTCNRGIIANRHRPVTG